MNAKFHSSDMANSNSDTMTLAELETLAFSLERERRLEDARDAFDAALRMDPGSQSASDGRARVAIQLGEDDAVEHCARALAFRDDDPELQAQMIDVAAGGIGIAALPLLQAFLARHPEVTMAQELMADLRAQAGEGDAFADAYVTALSNNPTNKQLLMSYWGVLSRAKRFQQALDSMDASRSLFGNDRAFAMLETAVASHAGLTDRAGALLEQQDDQPDAQLARGMNCIQTGRPDEAAILLEGVVDLQPDNLEAWSLLELAWRLTNNPRHEWLIGRPMLYGSSELQLSSSELASIAAMLRTMHRASAQPIGQSLRGGTQTPGQLFERSNPEMELLTDALAAVIRQVIADLPPVDPRHPLLRHRDMGIAFGPSWSVRFTEGGHHAAHFHPGGILSSACYICVPETLADEEEKPGWLEIGRPPPEFGLDLAPLATFEPKPGRLVLFPSFLFHGTRPFSGGERLTVAFDLVPVAMS